MLFSRPAVGDPEVNPRLIEHNSGPGGELEGDGALVEASCCLTFRSFSNYVWLHRAMVPVGSLRTETYGPETVSNLPDYERLDPASVAVGCPRNPNLF